MNLVNDKEILKKCIKIIRQEKLETIFTHGPFDYHRDHINTHFISVEAPGEPVAVELGEPWNTPFLYYYFIIIDITDVEVISN